jgi:hypothetical protein
MESTPAGFKSNNGGKGLSAFDKKPLGEKFGNKDVSLFSNLTLFIRSSIRR